MKIFCIGRNYVDHAKELNNAVPKEPLVFMKPPTALNNNNKDFYYPEFSKDIHHELELVIRVCKNGKHIGKGFAKNYYEQVTVGIDLTARDLQAKLKEKGHPWEIAKGFDGSAIIGSWLNINDFDKNNIPFTLMINNQTKQVGTSKDMIFHFDALITHISQFYTVQQGDLIFTGTPAGVGPIQIGDCMEGFIADKKLFSCHIK